MKEYITTCPCCDKQLKILIDGSGNLVSTTFFDEENQADKVNIEQLLVEKGIYFGCKNS